MDTETTIREGHLLTGPLFSEPMRVETVRSIGLGLLRLGLQAYALGIAYEFDPYFGLSISRVDPLPHQLEAVYDHLLKLPSVRFLLADDAGAGKTIMAGLLLRELKLRGLIERVLVVCPANLAFQWQRELSEKFDEKFIVLKGSDIRDQFGVNQWMEQKQIITSAPSRRPRECAARPGCRRTRAQPRLSATGQRTVRPLSSWLPGEAPTRRDASRCAQVMAKFCASRFTMPSRAVVPKHLIVNAEPGPHND